MSQQDKDKEEASDLTGAVDALQSQVDVLTQGRVPPALGLDLWSASEDGDAEENGMQMTSTPNDSAPGLPGLHLMTGLVTGHATEEEQRLWDDVYAEDPGAQARLGKLDDWSQSADIDDELASIMARGSALTSTMAPLSSDFWAQLDAPEDAGEGVASVASAPAELAWTDEPVVAVSEPGEPGPEASTPTPADPGWTDWMRWGAPAVLTLGWFLLFPNASTQDMGALPDSSVVVPLYRPSPSIAQYKGAALPRPTPSKISIEIYRRRQKQVKRMPQRFVAKAGDELRFFVRQPMQKKLFLLLFLSEESGEVSHLYPAREGGVFRMPIAPKGKYLAGGASVTALRGHERIFACVSAKAIPYQRALSLLRQAKKSRVLANIHTLPLPCLHQKSWLLLPKKEQKRNKR